MSMIDRSLDGMAHLSGQLGAILHRRLRELGGLALISLACWRRSALATWSVKDPSLSHATDAPVRNLLGAPGAIAADLTMQLLGLGSLALLLPIAVWGWRLLGHRPLSHERLRVLLWLVGAVLTAAFASCLPRSAAGRCRPASAASSATRAAPASLSVACAACRHASLGAAMVLGAAALVTFVGAAGFSGATPSDEDEEDEEEEEEPAEDDDDERLDLARLLDAFAPELPRAIGAAVPRPAARRRCRRATTPRCRAAASSRASAPAGARPTIEDEEDEADDDAEAAPRARKPRGGAEAAPLRRRLCAAAARTADAAEQGRPRHRQPGNAAGKRHRARRRARRFRRARRDHQCAAGPGGDALRARAGAGHQIVAGDQPRRRHRALDERAVGARRRGVRPQRHRHRAAEPDARESLSARDCSPRDDYAETTAPAAALPRQDDRRRSRCSSISPACRIC